jgi:hypothetical protein
MPIVTAERIEVRAPQIVKMDRIVVQAKAPQIVKAERIEIVASKPAVNQIALTAWNAAA